MNSMVNGGADCFGVKRKCFCFLEIWPWNSGSSQNVTASMAPGSLGVMMNFRLVWLSPVSWLMRTAMMER